MHVYWFVLAWGGAAMVGGLFGAAQAGILPRLSQVGRWLRTHRDLGVRYFSENLTYSAATQLRLYGVGAIVGLAAVGALRGAELLLGPVNLIMMGLGTLMAIPEAARLANRDLARMRRFVVGLAVLLAAVAVLWGLVVGLLPDRSGSGCSARPGSRRSRCWLPITAMVALLGVWSSAWAACGRWGRPPEPSGPVRRLVGVPGRLAGRGRDRRGHGRRLGQRRRQPGRLLVWWRQFHLAAREFVLARPSEADTTALPQGG